MYASVYICVVRTYHRMITMTDPGKKPEMGAGEKKMCKEPLFSFFLFNQKFWMEIVENEL